MGRNLDLGVVIVKKLLADYTFYCDWFTLNITIKKPVVGKKMKNKELRERKEWWVVQGSNLRPPD